MGVQKSTQLFPDKGEPRCRNYSRTEGVFSLLIYSNQFLNTNFACDKKNPFHLQTLLRKGFCAPHSSFLSKISADINKFTI